MMGVIFLFRQISAKILQTWSIVAWRMEETEVKDEEGQLAAFFFLAVRR